jgi:hypothetical protein
MSWENLRNLKKYREGFERLMIWDRRQKQRVLVDDIGWSSVDPNTALVVQHEPLFTSLMKSNFLISALIGAISCPC